MSKEEFCARPAVCRKRFKGIENFLKRVAFNLGNTPSQTEVKIISCIPIDVTDLQQKILHLERQLDEAAVALRASPSNTSKTSKASKSNKKGKQGKNKTAVNTALVDNTFPNVSTAAISCKSLDCDQSTSPVCSQNKRKSIVSFIFPAFSNSNVTPITPSNHNLETSQVARNTETPQQFSMDPYYPPYTGNKICEIKSNYHRRNFFKKKKKLFKNKKCTSPYVYYAQTSSCTPFNKSEMTDDFPKHHKTDLLTRSYLNKMINKQYKPKVLGDNISILSQFSSPICRDVQPRCKYPTCVYESDICSCCHGPFHNIDEQISKLKNPQTYMVNEINTGSAYYDTNQYDLVPVKEKPVKVKKESELPRVKDLRPHVDMKCWPENVRTKHRYYTLHPLAMTNYHIPRPRAAEYIIANKLDSYGRKRPMKFNRIEPIAKAKRRKEMYRKERSVNIETSKSCSIDFGNVYTKKHGRKPKKHESLQSITIRKKNAECLTTVINNTECQTTMTTVEANISDVKTEATLNQIKSILQSVLAEVKVSSQTKSQVIQDKPKRDAVVQKGPSHNNMQTSSFMNSITYSPYAMNPQYIASCSRQLNPSQFCYPQGSIGGMKCFQNFPLFVPNPGRHMCASCYRNSSHFKSSYMRQATTTATNTDDLREDRTKETEKLIKEIYKSMALTMDLPNKDTSLSEYDEMMKSMQGFTTPVIIKTERKKQPNKIRNVVQAVSELFMKKDMIDTSDTLNTTTDTKLPSHNISTRSQLVTTTDTEFKDRQTRYENRLRGKDMQLSMTDVEHKLYREAMVPNANAITESSDTSSSETDTDSTMVAAKSAQKPKLKKEKQGLFSKMLHSVKLFKPRERSKKRDERTESEEETTSDSDDYQTVYSQKIEISPKHKVRPHNLPKRKTHSKISYKQSYQRDRSPEKRRASPYMEQEYRRYWDERLMFHDKRPRHSSDRFYSDQTTPQKSPYYQTYETRNALVDPKSQTAEPNITKDDGEDNRLKLKAAAKGMAWLKKHKMGINCGEQWKKLLIEG